MSLSRRGQFERFDLEGERFPMRDQPPPVGVAKAEQVAHAHIRCQCEAVEQELDGTVDDVLVLRRRAVGTDHAQQMGPGGER